MENNINSKNKTETTNNINENENENMNDNINKIETILLINDNIRKNIKLSLAIFKKLNNFDHNYIHEFFDKEKSKL